MRRALLLIPFVLAACDTRATSSPVRSYYAQVNAAAQLVCDCYAANGFASEAECLGEARAAQPSEVELTCLDAAYYDNASAAREPVQCTISALTALNTCLRAVPACNSAMSRACTNEYADAVALCSTLPSAVSTRFAACTGSTPPPPPRENTYSTCEETVDCTDLDDECFFVALGATGTSGNFCSRECLSDFDCESSGGFSGACYSLDDTIPLCYQTCVIDADCFPSSVCIPVSASGVAEFVCVPDN